MALIGESVVNVVDHILGDLPDTTVHPQIWQELMKLRSAVKSLAAAAQAKIEAYVDVPFQELGTIEAAVYLGPLTTVKVTAAQAIFAGALVWFRNTPSGLRAYMAYDGPADGVAVSAVAGGVVGEFILKGLYVTSTLTPANETFMYPHHGRLSTIRVITDHSNNNVSATYAGLPCWNSSSFKVYLYQYYYGYWFIGTRLGYVGAYSAQSYKYALNAIVYFNPRRV